MSPKNIYPPAKITLEQLTLEQETDLNHWFDQLEKNWLSAIEAPNSPESQELVEMEAAWQARQEYYHDQCLYADRL